MLAATDPPKRRTALARAHLLLLIQSVVSAPQGAARSVGGATSPNSPGVGELKREETGAAHRVQGAFPSKSGVARGLAGSGWRAALPEHGGGWGSLSTMRSAPVAQRDGWLLLHAGPLATACWGLGWPEPQRMWCGAPAPIRRLLANPPCWLPTSLVRRVPRSASTNPPATLCSL